MGLKYRAYINNPWTRDGQVRAEIIQIAPRVSGPVVELAIRDNQMVAQGDLLFRIDPRTFQAAVDAARARLETTGDSVKALEQQAEGARAAVEAALASIEQAKSGVAAAQATVEQTQSEFERQQALLAKRSTSQKSVEAAKANYEVSQQRKKSADSQLVSANAALAEARASLAQAEAQLGALGDANPQVRAALAAVYQAELNLEFTEVRASVDGYVTNLNVRIGTQAVANQPMLALVDINSYWIDGFFRENVIEDIQPGNKAAVTLMSYPDHTIEGYVDSLGWGIAQKDGSTGYNLLPNVSPTFEWIRLAQRIPVRVHLGELPEGVELRVGTTCSVLVRKGTESGEVPPVPKLLQ